MRTTYLWLLQLVTGVLIAVFLGIHLVIQHLNAVLGFFGIKDADPTSWAAMVARSSQGIWVFIYLALLAVGIYHGANGLRNIILEVTSSAQKGRVITGVIIVVGVIFFILGTYVPVALLSS